MAYQYADWQTKATDELRLAAARLHHAEVSADMGASIGSGSMSRDPSGLTEYLANLQIQIDRLAARTSTSGTRSGVVRMRFD